MKCFILRERVRLALSLAHFCFVPFDVVRSRIFSSRLPVLPFLPYKSAQWSHNFRMKSIWAGKLDNSVDVIRWNVQGRARERGRGSNQSVWLYRKVKGRKCVKAYTTLQMEGRLRLHRQKSENQLLRAQVYLQHWSFWQKTSDIDRGICWAPVQLVSVN